MINKKAIKAAIHCAYKQGCLVMSCSQQEIKLIAGLYEITSREEIAITFALWRRRIKGCNYRRNKYRNRALSYKNNK